MKSYLNPVILLTLLVTLLLSTSLTDATVQSRTNDTLVASQPTPPLDEAQVTTALQSSPVMFIENVGQFDDDARFHLRGGQFSMWLADEALWITLLEQSDEEQPPLTAEEDLREPTTDSPRRGVNLKLSFVDANPQPTIEPFNRLESKVNYFLGNEPEKWRSDVPVWGGVRYKNLYPGIDLELTSENGQTVQRLVAHPDADLSMVSLRVEGAESIELLPSNTFGRGAGGEGLLLPSNTFGRGAGGEGGEGHSLHITTTIGSLTLPLLPVVTPDGTPLDITTTPSRPNNDILAPFAPYYSNTTPHLPLVTGSTLAYSTFVGGTGTDVGRSLALDKMGTVVTGYTTSSDFPTTAGGYDTTHNGSWDLFVFKLASDGGSLLYSTFVGGTNYDSGRALALDSAGNAIITGETYSSDFPTTAGGYDTTHNGGGDLFVFKLASDGGSLLYSTFVGGTSTDVGRALVLDSAANAVITGLTESSDFPTTAGSYDTTHNGNGDVFVAKLASDGGSLLHSTFVGGTSTDYGFSLALDSAANAVITGYTGSSNFPTTAGGYDTTHNGSYDLFVAKIASDGGSLLYSTFVGGTSYDWGYSLALDSAANAIITGETYSLDFPTTAGGYDTTNNGSGDVFVAKIASDGGSLLYSTFVGGTSYDWGYSLALDSAANAIITGYTSSSDFPTAGGYDTTHNGSYDLFVAKIASDGASLLYSTFVGGTNWDKGSTLALDSAGNVIITGYTESADFPTTAGGYDTTHNGDRDVFVLRLDGLDSVSTPTPTKTPTSTNTEIPTDTPTNSPTNTPTNSPSATITPGGPTLTPSHTPSVTHTPTQTPTATRTNTPSATITPGGPTLTPSHTPSVTHTATQTPTATRTNSPTATITPGGPTLTPSHTPSVTHTPTQTPTATRTNSPTATITPGGPTLTPSHTPSVTHTATQTPTATRTNSPSATITPGGPTLTPTNTPTPSGTGDAYEVDDECEQASPIATTGVVQNHTFHTPGDVDWAEFEAISGTTYLIEAQTPSESTADVVLEVYSRCGTLPTFSQDYTFTPDIRLSFTAIEDGPLYLQLSNHDPDVGGPDKSYRLSIRALGDSASPGALVLVAGRIRANDDPLQSQIHNVTNEVYRTFLRHGYDSDHIFYLAHDLKMDADDDGTPDVDARATHENLEQAITDWAVGKVGPDRPFTLYLMDHGGEDVFFLNGRTDTVAPEEVDQWLEALEEAAGNVKVNIFMEACHSGSFLESVSGDGRVVMASTGTYAVAYASPSGAVFSDAFLSGLERGMSLYGAFSEAQWIVQEAHPDQTPWMDDDGNGIPNQGADGLEAQRRGFAYADEKWPPYIASAEVADIQGETGVIRADVRDDVSVLTVSAVVYKPSYTPPNPDETEEIVLEKLPTVTLLDSEGDGIYSAVYEGFNETGSYRLVIYAQDGEGIAGRPLAIEIQISRHQLYLPSVMR